MIPLIKTLLPPKEKLLPKLEEVLYSGYIAQGSVVDEFEEEFSKFIGAKNCLSVNSGTSALHVALTLAGVEQGHEVISTTITAEPTNTVITQTGAKIIWADIDLNTGNLCPDSVESKITDKTKAIIAVDYAGTPINIKRFQEIEEKYNIPIIQDSAHALGAIYQNKRLGNHFRYTTFSFQAIKHMTTVDGGMICIKNNNEFEQAKLIRWFGIKKGVSRLENNIHIQGYKYHMNNVNATIGLVQLENISETIDKYIENGKFYDKELQNIEGVELLKYYPESQPSYWLYTLKVQRRGDFIKAMADNGIMASELHKRNDLHSIFSNFKTELPNVDRFEKSWVHIPSGWWVTEQDREKIVDCIKKGW